MYAQQSLLRFPAQLGLVGKVLTAYKKAEQEEIKRKCETNLCSDGDGQEMNKANVLVPDDLDLVDEP